MFGVEQYKRLEIALKKDPSLDAFENLYVSTGSVLPSDDGAAASVPIGTFYPPDRVFGEPIDPACLHGIQQSEIAGPPPELVKVEGGKIVGNTAVLGRDGRLFSPELLTPQNSRFLLDKNSRGFEGYMLSAAEDGGLIARFLSRRQPRHFDMDAMFIPSPEPGNYGSFMFRQLPQLFAIAEAKPDFDCYIVPERTSFFTECLILLDLPRKPIFATKEVAGETFRSITTGVNFDREAFLHPATLNGLSQSVARYGQASGPRKIYIARSLSSIGRPWYRVMTNELDIETQLRGRGYEVIYPETLGLRGQIEAFAHAEKILGPSGSGMFNTMFAPPGAHLVDIETYHVTVRQHAKLYSSLGHRYAFVFSPADPSDTGPLIRRRWSLEQGLLDQAVQWLEAA